MSRTDTHRPFKAQVADSPRAWHDHTNGECNLPTLEEWAKMTRRAQREWKSCTWQPSNWNTYKGFRRYKGEGEWVARSKTRKARNDWRSEGMSDLYDTLAEKQEDEDNYREGCMWCCNDN